MPSRLQFVTSVAATALQVAQASPPGPIPIRIGTTGGDDATPVIYGQGAGIFLKAGLDVQIDRLSGGAAIAAGVLAGTFAFGKSSITTLVDAHEKGIEFPIVTSGVLQDRKAPYAVFLVAKDSPLHGPRDFADQKVGISSLGDIGSVALSKWISDAGGDVHRIQFVEVPLYESGPALAQHRVDAAEAGYPSLVGALATGQFRVLPAYDAIAPEYLLTAWFTTAEYARKNSDIVRRFVHAFKEAATYTNGHHAETAPLMSKFTGIDPDVFRTMLRAPSPPELHLSLIQPIIDAMAAQGRIKHAFAAREIVAAG